MLRIQTIRCGASERKRYFLAIGSAWLIAIFALACDSADRGSGELRSSPGSSADFPSSTVVSDSGTSTGSSRGEGAGSSPVSGFAEDRPVIVFLGTSLTAGYGLREDQAFPALIQERIEAASLPHRVVNAGVSGDTSAGGLRRLDWLLRLPIQVLVLELGANDMLRGLSVSKLEQNLDEILTRTAESRPGARFLVAGMRAAPNLGSDYRAEFDRIYPDLARRHEASLIPFLLDGVAARPHLNQADGIHPTPEGHEVIAKQVWERLEPLLDAN